MISVSDQFRCAVCFENKPSDAFVPYQVKGNPEHHKVHECWIDAHCLLEHIDAKKRLGGIENAACPLCNKEITLVGGVPARLIRAALGLPRPPIDAPNHPPYVSSIDLIRNAFIAHIRATPDRAHVDFALLCAQSIRIDLSSDRTIRWFIEFNHYTGVSRDGTSRAGVAMEKALLALERAIAAPAPIRANIDSAFADLDYAAASFERSARVVVRDANAIGHRINVDIRCFVDYAYFALVLGIHNTGALTAIGGASARLFNSRASANFEIFFCLMLYVLSIRIVRAALFRAYSL